jgi:hypothetical protein
MSWGGTAEQALSLVAERFRALGYTVTEETASDQLPDFIRVLQPDLIAIRDRDRVAVIIKLYEEDRPVPPRAALIKLREEGWRLELVLASDLVARVTSAEDIAERLNAAVQLSDLQHDTAGLLIAWTAAEEVLRLLAYRYAPELLERKVISPQMAFSAGLLSENQHRWLSSIFRLRNDAAHGPSPLNDIPQARDLILSLQELLNRMAEPLYVPPPIMADRILADPDLRGLNPLEQVRIKFPQSHLEEQHDAADYVASAGETTF